MFHKNMMMMKQAMKSVCKDTEKTNFAHFFKKHNGHPPSKTQNWSFIPPFPTDGATLYAR
jgi:hypothetical protein